MQELRQKIENKKMGSAWGRGVKEYALELLESFEENYQGEEITKEKLLNGAENWEQYSKGGCSLIYDYDIAERTCSPSELKKTKEGERMPNKREDWLDVQARALYQASRMILRLVK